MSTTAWRTGPTARWSPSARRAKKRASDGGGPPSPHRGRQLRALLPHLVPPRALSPRPVGVPRGNRGLRRTRRVSLVARARDRDHRRRAPLRRHPRVRVLVSLLLLDVRPARGPATSWRAFPRLHAARLRRLDLQPRRRPRPPPPRPLLPG